MKEFFIIALVIFLVAVTFILKWWFSSSTYETVVV